MRGDFEKRISDLLNSASEPLTPQEVAKKLKISRTTAQIHLFKLLAQNPHRVKCARKGRQSLFWADKKAIRIRFRGGKRMPSLGELSDQLENEWLDESTSEETIDRS
jgi:predicted ArsR family transcriptional regulator